MSAELDALMEENKIKLEYQQKQKEKEEQEQQQNYDNGDIYADFRDEGDTSYPDIKTPEPYVEEKFIEKPISENDEQIYENGPYQSQVDIWKKQYGEGHVYHTQVIEKHFVFRTLNRSEYKQIVAMENIDALMREEVICQTCVLHPRNYNWKQMAVNEAGYPSTLSQIILENSGFTNEYSIGVL